MAKISSTLDMKGCWVPFDITGTGNLPNWLVLTFVNAPSVRSNAILRIKKVAKLEFISAKRYFKKSISNFSLG